MSSSAATFPARFAELVYLLANQPDATAEQESALDAAARAVTDRYASLTTSQLNVDLLDVAQTTVGVHLHELVMRMSAHSAHQIDFLAKTPRAEILGVARILASEARPHDDGAAFDEKLVQLSPTLVEVHLGRNGFIRAGSLAPPASLHVGVPSVRVPTPFQGMPAFGGRTPPRGGDAIAPPPPSVRATPTRGAAAVSSGAEYGRRRTDAWPGPGTSRPLPPMVPAIRDDSSRIIEGAIKTKSLVQLSDDELIERLRTGVTTQNALTLLDELAVAAEARAVEHRWETVARIFQTVV